ncbi:hypothetical protein SFOMI_2761 [Sphingobium fuliginis]|uniref:Uncharacterized protein n=1 Tax=Sphingobium fuliginis (strain ATCC 27551) TaxID=336203 RepID=A0A292ZH00_SPHSA|nr:hypothetical protein SFOMI_2761 [Sphingobium fuliginis]
MHLFRNAKYYFENKQGIAIWPSANRMGPSAQPLETGCGSPAIQHDAEEARESMAVAIADG